MSRKELIEQVLSYTVSQEDTILGDTRAWKSIVLRNYNKVARQERSVSELLEIIEDAGFEYMYSETISRAAVLELLEYIAHLSNDKNFNPKINDEFQYNLLYTKLVGGGRKAYVMDFQNGNIISFQLNNLNSIDNVELVEYISSKWDKINRGYYDVSG